jgi:hypothetical protein
MQLLGSRSISVSQPVRHDKLMCRKNFSCLWQNLKIILTVSINSTILISLILNCATKLLFSIKLTANSKKVEKHWSTVCFTDLDPYRDDVFESILTNFIASVFLKAAGSVAKIGSSFKLNHHKQI